MADVNLSFSNVTTSEARTAAWALARANEERVAAELPPYANIAEMLEAHIVDNMLPSWQVAEAADTGQTDNVTDLWKEATDAQRAAALAALTA